MKRLAILILAACGGVPQNTDTLGDAIRSYNDGVRWGRYTVAAAKVPARERAQFIEDMDERGDNLKITDYDIVDVNAKSSREARVRIKIGWYADDEGTVHETHAVQTWERQGKLWFMVQEQRVRGKEMPGLPEPAEGVEEKKSPRKTEEPPQDSRTSRRPAPGRGNISP
jgi:hypothetical protein